MMTSREKELFEYVSKDINFIPLIRHVVTLEERLEELAKLPFVKVHPADPTRQKVLPAGKQYKELLQQYINGLKVLQRRAGGDALDDESPLRRWLNENLLS